MKWVSAKEALPTKYQWYLIAKMCPHCLKNEDHYHPCGGPNRPFEYGMARWSSKDMNLVNYYRAKGDHSWDFAEHDRWTDASPMLERMTHWLEFPNYPEECNLNGDKE